MTQNEIPLDYQVFDTFCLAAYCGHLKFGIASYEDYQLHFLEPIKIKRIAYNSWIAQLKEILKVIGGAKFVLTESLIAETFSYKILWKAHVTESNLMHIEFYQKKDDIISRKIILDTNQISNFIESFFNLVFTTYCYSFKINHCLKKIISTFGDLNSQNFSSFFTYKRTEPTIKDSLLELGVEVKSDLVYHIFACLQREKDIIINLCWLGQFQNKD